MKCPSIDIIQSYIDGELGSHQKNEFESHLLKCDKCSLQYKELKNSNDLVSNVIGEYKNYMEENIVPQIKPFNTAKAAINKENQKKPGRITAFTVKYKKIAAIAAAVAFITSYATIQPVRAAVSDVLSIFRAQNLTGINITVKDIDNIQKQLQSKEPEIDLKNMGKISVKGGEQKHTTPAEASALQDFKIQLPGILKESTPEISITNPMSVSFNMNAEKVNSIMKSFGAVKLLPENITGKTFELNTPLLINASYNINGKIYNVLQTKAPQVIIPDGVDADEIYEAMTELPILPESIQKQFKAIKDWRNTLFIPVVESKTEEVDINGIKGYLYPQISFKNASSQPAIIWSDGGIIRGITGTLSRDELLNLAKSMR